MHRGCGWPASLAVLSLVLGVTPPATAEPLPGGIAALDTRRAEPHPTILFASEEAEGTQSIREYLLSVAPRLHPPPGFMSLEARELRIDERNHGTNLIDRVEYLLSGEAGHGVVQFRVYGYRASAESAFRQLLGTEGRRPFADELDPAELTVQHVLFGATFSLDPPNLLGEGVGEVAAECALTLIPQKSLVRRCAVLDPRLPVIVVVRKFEPAPASIGPENLDGQIGPLAPIAISMLLLLLRIE